MFLVLPLLACGGEAGSDADSADAGTETEMAESAEASPGAEADEADMGQTGDAEVQGQAQEAMGSGIEGRAVIGPTCPAQRVDEPCPQRPYPTTLTIVDTGSGDVVTTVKCDDQGYFQAELPPGSYRVVPPEAQVVTAPRAAPMTVDVKAGQYTEVVMRFDSGMR